MSKSKFTIFFSWQSDIKGNTKIIRDSLKAECQKQKENGYEVNIDEATRYLPGSPKIEDVVLEKIENADIFICDITPIIVSKDGKQMPNSNVIFELGYALHILGDKRIIMLAKKGPWETKDMPFDFNHRRIGIFSSAKDCDLSFEIDSCIKECIAHPLKKFKWESIINGISSFHFFNKSTSTEKQENLNAGEKEIPLVKATEESTVFFARRMASAFHGIRGLAEIGNTSEIRKDLNILLQYPLHFAPGLDKGEVDPVWWFRGGSGCDIKSFELLNSKKILIDIDELKIKRILVYRDPGSYYSQYVYIETYPDKPTGLYHINQDVYKDVMQWQGYLDEEYADFKPAWYLPTFHITRQDYDDGATNIFGKHVELKQRAKLRCRYLTPYNFIICAKGSPYNSREFSSSSEDVFRGMLEDEISNDDFNSYMMKFPKRSY